MAIAAPSRASVLPQPGFELPSFAFAALAETLPGAEEARQAYAQFIGSVLTETVVQKPEAQAGSRESLLAVLQSSELSEDDIGFIEKNAETKVAEALSKSGNILKVAAHINDDGEIEQFGQTTQQRQRMTMLWYPDQSPALLANTHVEGQNAFTMEHIHRIGEPRRRRFMEVSMVLNTATRQELVDYGYFLDSMTAIIRLTDISTEGDVDIISGLVGGVDEDILPAYEPNETQADEDARLDMALENRFDIAVVRELYAQLGVEGAEYMNTTELLSAMVAIPDTLDEIDIMMVYDQIASDKLEKPVFFGLTGLAREHYAGRPFTRDDYITHRERIKARQESFKPTAKAVAAELLERRHEPQTPIQATALLDEIAKKHVLRHAVRVDTSIDARLVFGRQAAVLVDDARIAAEWGDQPMADQKIEAAAKVAKVTGCPTPPSREQGTEKKRESKSTNNDASSKYGDKKGNDKSGNNKKERYSKREWMRCVTCPLCKRKPVDASIDYYPKKKIITCTGCKGCKVYDR